MSSGIKIFAPATVANLACGFDVLGLALEQPGDEIIVRLAKTAGVKITKITGDNGKLPLDASKNTAGIAAQAVLNALEDTTTGVELEIHKKMPFGSGLGSSAASAVAGAMAMNEILRHPFSKRELLPFAMAGENAASGAWHADNIAPCLIGGIMMIRSNKDLDVHRLPVPKGLYVTVIYPHIELLTKTARAILSDKVDLKNAIQQTANIAGFIQGLYTSNFELIANSLQDTLIEHQRAALIPNFYEIKETALSFGALGCSISGAGPSIFAIFNRLSVAEETALKMQMIWSKNKIQSSIYISPINQEGAILL